VITDEGKIYIKRYLAGWVPTMANSMAFGVGDNPEVANEKKLNFEIGRTNIAVRSYDFVNDKLIFKAPLPEGIAGTIYEVALYSQEKNSLAGDYGSQLLTTFESDDDWINPVNGNSATFSTANTRIGNDSVSLTAAASATTRARLEGISMDFSGSTMADRFMLSMNVSTNTSAVDLKFMTDNSNYYTFTFNPASGYRIQGKTLGTSVSTGNPNWSDINMLELSLTATSGGTSTLDLDGLRIEDLDSPNPEYIMIAREVLGTPFVKEENRIQDIEFAINVSL
jgi:hypothetical protein